MPAWGQPCPLTHTLLRKHWHDRSGIDRAVTYIFSFISLASASAAVSITNPSEHYSRLAP